MICSESEFFRAALNGPWTESQTRQVELSEENPAVFGLFVHWLYSGKVAVNTDERKAADLLFEAYKLGDKLRALRFMNYTIDICATSSMKPTDDFVATLSPEYVYKHTPSESKFRRLYRDLWICESTWDELQASVQNVGSKNEHQFAIDMMLELFYAREDRSDNPPYLKINNKFCKRYHEHKGLEKNHVHREKPGSSAICQAGVELQTKVYPRSRRNERHHLSPPLDKQRNDVLDDQTQDT